MYEYERTTARDYKSMGTSQCGSYVPTRTENTGYAHALCMWLHKKIDPRLVYARGIFSIFFRDHTMQHAGDCRIAAEGEATCEREAQL